MRLHVVLYSGLLDSASAAGRLLDALAYFSLWKLLDYIQYT